MLNLFVEHGRQVNLFDREGKQIGFVRVVGRDRRGRAILGFDVPTTIIPLREGVEFDRDRIIAIDERDDAKRRERV